MKALPLLLVLVLAAGCSSSETEGFMSGDDKDLNGNPRTKAAAPPAPPIPGAASTGKPEADVKSAAGAYAPDRTGKKGS